MKPLLPTSPLNVAADPLQTNAVPTAEKRRQHQPSVWSFPLLRLGLEDAYPAEVPAPSGSDVTRHPVRPQL